MGSELFPTGECGDQIGIDRATHVFGNDDCGRGRVGVDVAKGSITVAPICHDLAAYIYIDIRDRAGAKYIG